MSISFSNELKAVAGEGRQFLRLDSYESAKAAAQYRFQTNTKRLDSIVAPSRAMHLARELEFAYQELLREQYLPLSGLEMFPVDSRVPEGANSYKIERISHTGDARWHRGNNYDTPNSGASKEEEIRPVRHIISSISLDVFEDAASRYAGSNLRGELREGAMRAIDEFLNEKIWSGDEDVDVYGILNYPYVPKTASTVSLSSATTDPNDILAELHRLSNLNNELTSTTFMPNTLAMSIRAYNYLKTTKRSATTDQTILEAFLQDSVSIDEVKPVRELQAAGPGGEDVLLFFRRQDQRAASLVIPTRTKMLPIQEIDFELRIPLYMSYGGVMMRDPLHNLVCYTPAV